ncbi:MAG: VanZ family protein, partial [Nocardioides sp.]
LDDARWRSLLDHRIEAAPQPPSGFHCSDPRPTHLDQRPLAVPATVDAMFPVGGVEVMVLGAMVVGGLCLLLVRWLKGRLGSIAAIALAGLVWSVVVIGLVTLIPANGAPGWVPAEGRLDYCSRDIGGPAPDGFWIVAGTQRLLNTVVFVPAGICSAVLALRWPKWALFTVPLGLVGLSGYAVAIEFTQLALARLDRACDVTDMIDNAAGAALGVVVGLVLATVLRPWRARR